MIHLLYATEDTEIAESIRRTLLIYGQHDLLMEILTCLFLCVLCALCGFRSGVQRDG